MERRRPLQQLITTDEHRQPPVSGDSVITANAAHQHLFSSRRMHRLRIGMEPDPIGFGKNRLGLRGIDRLVELQMQGDRMGSRHRNPHTRGGYADFGILLDASGFHLHFSLFRVHAIFTDR